jgi:hypothetical protein
MYDWFKKEWNILNYDHFIKVSSGYNEINTTSIWVLNGQGEIYEILPDKKTGNKVEAPFKAKDIDFHYDRQIMGEVSGWAVSYDRELWYYTYDEEPVWKKIEGCKGDKVSSSSYYDPDFTAVLTTHNTDETNHLIRVEPDDIRIGNIHTPPQEELPIKYSVVSSQYVQRALYIIGNSNTLYWKIWPEDRWEKILDKKVTFIDIYDLSFIFITTIDGRIYVGVYHEEDKMKASPLYREQIFKRQ